MKKPWSAALLVVLLLGSFLGGIWYNQRGAGKNNAPEGRRILHYVDPMNPAHTSDKPGIAPCGMPMEPVFSDAESPGQGSPTTVLSLSPGTVKITPQKQQIIGVQTGKVEVLSETHSVRTLGRVVANENWVYRLIAATDGWMSDIKGSTTGSLVQKDQVMALMKVYSYDFFSWQQRFLTELRNTGRRRPPAAPVTGARQPGLLQYGVPQVIKPQPGTTQHWEMKPAAPKPGAPRLGAQSPETQQPGAPQTGAPQPRTSQPWGIPPGATQYGGTLPATPQPMSPQSGAQLPGAPQSEAPQTAITRPGTMQPGVMPPGAMHQGETPPAAPQPMLLQPGSQSPGTPQSGAPQTVAPLPGTMQPGASPPATAQPGAMSPGTMQDDCHQMEAQQHGAHQPEGTQPAAEQPPTDPSKHAESALKPDITELDFVGEDDIFYASKGKLELLALGVSRTQLEDLAETGRYVTYVELRSPVTGLVLARNVSPQQRVDKGTECFKIADLSRVWIVADVFPAEGQYIKPGMRARISLPQQNQVFEATVTDVPPVFNAATRTLKVRLEVDNPGLCASPGDVCRCRIPHHLSPGHHRSGGCGPRFRPTKDRFRCS